MRAAIAIALFAAAFAATLAEPASGRQVTVTGLVREQGDGTPIADATIRLQGAPRTHTNGDGRFILEGITPGSYTLAVEALGYVPRRIDLVIRGDTALLVELEADPVLIDQIEARVVTIRGTLHDAATGARIPSGQVRIEPAGETGPADNGAFRIRGVQAGPIRVVVRAIEYLPAVVEFDAQRDTTLRFDMRVDSVGLRLLFQQVDRLAQRAEAEPYSVRELNRDDIRRSGAASVGDLIARQLPSWGGRGPVSLRRRDRAGRSGFMRSASGPACVTYDDMPVDLIALSGILSEDIERIEIFGYSGAMVRIYSKRYVASLMGREQLPRIIFLTTGLSSVCM